MTEIDPTMLSSEDVRVLDARYAGFPAFSEWADATVPTELWDATIALLAERKALAPAGAFDELVERAMRAARGVAAQDLRDSEGLRQRVAAQLSQVQTSLDALLVERPRRRILRQAAPGGA